MTQKNQQNNIEIPGNPIKFLWFATKPHLWFALLAMLFSTTAAVFDVLQIYAISNLIDNFSQAEGQAEQLQALKDGGIIFLAVLSINMLLWRLSGFTGIAWIIRADARAYKALYEYITKHSHSYFSDRFAGALSNKISNAAGGTGKQIEQILWRGWPELISLLVTIYLFFAIDFMVGALALAIIIIVVGFNIWRVKKRRPFVVDYSFASSKLRGEGVDMLTNISAMRQYVQRDSEMSRLQAVIKDKVGKDFRQWYMGERTMVANSSFGSLLLLLVLVFVYTLLESGQATAGNLILVLILLSRVAHTFNITGMLLNGFIRQYGEVEEGLEEVLAPHEIVDEKNATPLQTKGGSISFNQVLFEFAGQPVFKSFDLTIEAGQRMGLVGQSGAGKSTLVSLLLRQHDIDAGEIAIDGQNIAQVTQDSLRSAIAVVPQEPALFHRTIRENIAYGKPDATDEEIIAVAMKAEAHNFIVSLPKGYDTMVGERGVKLSGGQKQRVAIARAMLKDAPILILDEATSALDSESEVAIQKALENLMEGRTVIAIAHRLSTLRKMDRIIVIENGAIIEDGNHESLSQGKGVYEKLWNHQAGGFLQD